MEKSEDNRKEQYIKYITKYINDIYLSRSNYSDQEHIKLNAFKRTFLIINFNQKDMKEIKEVVTIVNNWKGFYAKIIDIQNTKKLWVKWNSVFL